MFDILNTFKYFIRNNFEDSNNSGNTIDESLKSKTYDRVLDSKEIKKLDELFNKEKLVITNSTKRALGNLLLKEISLEDSVDKNNSTFLSYLHQQGLSKVENNLLGVLDDKEYNYAGVTYKKLYQKLDGRLTIILPGFFGDNQIEDVPKFNELDVIKYYNENGSVPENYKLLELKDDFKPKKRVIKISKKVRKGIFSEKLEEHEKAIIKRKLSFQEGLENEKPEGIKVETNIGKKVFNGEGSLDSLSDSLSINTKIKSTSTLSLRKDNFSYGGKISSGEEATIISDQYKKTSTHIYVKIKHGNKQGWIAYKNVIKDELNIEIVKEEKKKEDEIIEKKVILSGEDPFIENSKNDPKKDDINISGLVGNLGIPENSISELIASSINQNNDNIKKIDKKLSHNQLVRYFDYGQFPQILIEEHGEMLNNKEYKKILLTIFEKKELVQYGDDLSELKSEIKNKYKKKVKEQIIKFVESSFENNNQENEISRIYNIQERKIETFVDNKIYSAFISGAIGVTKYYLLNGELPDDIAKSIKDIAISEITNIINLDFEKEFKIEKKTIKKINEENERIKKIIEKLNSN